MIKVLFVDDEPNVLDGLRRMIKSRCQGIDARFATSANQALEMMSSDPAAVVVTDIAMPGRDGYSLVCELYTAYPDVVPIVLSGQWDDAMADQKLGPSVQFLTKPVELEKLIHAIAQAGFEVKLMATAMDGAHPHGSDGGMVGGDTLPDHGWLQ